MSVHQAEWDECDGCHAAVNLDCGKALNGKTRTGRLVSRARLQTWRKQHYSSPLHGLWADGARSNSRLLGRGQGLKPESPPLPSRHAWKACPDTKRLTFVRRGR